MLRKWIPDIRTGKTEHTSTIVWHVAMRKIQKSSASRRSWRRPATSATGTHKARGFVLPHGGSFDCWQAQHYRGARTPLAAISQTAPVCSHVAVFYDQYYTVRTICSAHLRTGRGDRHDCCWYRPSATWRADTTRRPESDRYEIRDRRLKTDTDITTECRIRTETAATLERGMKSRRSRRVAGWRQSKHATS